MNSQSLPGNPTQRNRRDFIRHAGLLATTALTGLGSPSLSAQGANAKIGVGFIGVGGRGRSHLTTVQSMVKDGQNIRIVAVNDTYGPRLQDAAKRTGATPYGSHRDLLEDQDVDVVCIASPDRLHILQALDAVRAGKDVYCEKPMAHWSQFEASGEFCREVKKLGRVVQVGNQGNSSRFWRKVTDLVQEGAIGRPQHVLAGYFRDHDRGERMLNRITDPDAKPGPELDWEAFLGDAPKVPYTVERYFCWRRYFDYAGGPCTDLFPHVYTPFVSALGLKFPSLVSASGGIFKYDDYDREVPDAFNMCMDFPQRCSVVLVCTEANAYMTEPAIRGDEGTITLQNVWWERGCDSITVHPKGQGSPRVIAGEKKDSTRAHWENFLHCVRTREKPVSDVEFGYHVQAALCMGMLGFLKKKVARFNFAKEAIEL